MRSLALSNKQVFSFFAESVWAHSSSTQFCWQSVPRRRAAHSERASTKNSTVIVR